MPRIAVARRAVRDLRRIGPGPDLLRIREALHRLGADEASLDIKPLHGRSPWMRLRVGDYRVVYRSVDEDAADSAVLVARIVHRRDLERAVATHE